HEVSMVNSGHRVTLTYNLYWDDIAEPGATVKAPTAVPANEALFRDALAKLLRDPTFLPDGGRFGFGLCHVYPIKDSINHVHKLLKGSDAVVWRICQRFGMRPKIFLVYEGSADYGVEERVILSDLPSFGNGDDGMEYENLIDRLKEQHKAIVIGRRKTSTRNRDEDEADMTMNMDDDVHYVNWVTEPKSKTAHKEAYIAMGNQAYLDCAYGSVCLLVQCRSWEKRANTNYC
ncbi:hypothetical protein EWM64_g2967, partial [Hericium alpestre]